MGRPQPKRKKATPTRRCLRLGGGGVTKMGGAADAFLNRARANTTGAGGRDADQTAAAFPVTPRVSDGLSSWCR